MNILDQDALEDGRSSKSGIEPRQRSLKEYISRGFIILDKPSGPTSHDVVATIKKILDIEKAGHSGTLDPSVSGVLPIALDEGTKILSTFVGASKRYICNLVLHDDVSEDKLQAILDELTGQIYQYPPLKSNVARRLRKRTIYRMELLEQKDQEYLLDISCEAGTYIRTLCIDIGKILGVGGKMKELRRVRSGSFSEDQSVTLHNVFDAYYDAIEGITEDHIKKIIHPIEEVVDLPRVVIRDNAIESIVHGAKVAVPGIIAIDEFSKKTDIQVLSCKGELIAIATSLMSSQQIVNNEHGAAIQPNRVIFDRDEYNDYSNLV